MSLSKEFIRRADFYIKNIPQRMYKHIIKFDFEGFFTYDRLTLDEAKAHEKQPMPAGLNWGKKWEYGWFFTTVTIPQECAGKRVIFSAHQGESVVFINNKVCGSFDREHSHITLCRCAKGGETFEIAIEAYAGHYGKDDLFVREVKADLVLEDTGISEFGEDILQKTVVSGSLGIFYEDVFQLWMDIKTLYSLRGELEENSLRLEKVDKALKDMINAVDIELPIDEFLEAVKKGREILKPALDSKNGTTAPIVYVTGHSHLDLEWLWTTNETRRKCARTLGNQLKIIEEYPEYKYIQSQPWILNTVKNEYPDLYEDVKKAVANGNIIVEGGTWVECDTNLLSGESLVRQFIKGKKFIKDEFGKDSEIFWLPDSFGMTGSLPQILKGCGIKYFYNAKLMWQYMGGEPYSSTSFIWKGIDGSEVVTYFTLGYAEETTPTVINSKWKMNKDKAEVPIGLMAFGHGDGGGGATRIHLEHLMREKDLQGMPKTIMASPNEFFDEMVNNCEVNKKYVGELYYTAHRGTYTTQGMTKKLLRRSEFALREAELWSALTGNYAKPEFDMLWEKAMFNHFHDIVPGTSLSEAHEQTEKDFGEVVEKAIIIADASINSQVNSEADSITVFNSLSWERDALVELPDGYTSVEGGKTQKLGDKIYAMVSVPACGYKSYKLGKSVTADAIADGSLVLENNLIRAEFNKNGELISIFDKESKTEFLSKPSNVIRMYRDMSCFFDAWDIDSYYEKEEVALTDSAGVCVEYKGELESCISIKRKINKSYVTQKAILKKDSKRIDFVTEVDWKETHKLLKVDFNSNIHTEEMVSETQYGYVKRPNHKTRQYDADRYEVWNYKWSALCESRRGLAVLNDCKYGISADGERMSLTLLRSTVNPARFADKRIHNFTYSVMPFTEELSGSNVVEQGYELNSPVLVKKGYAGEKSLISVSEKNVIVDAVKLAEDNSGDIIVRIYESMNTLTHCTLSFGFDVKEAYITNMLEDNIEKVEIKDNSIDLSLHGFEVVTLRIKK